MRKNIFLLVSAVVMLSSCRKFLDINTNPNEATSATAQLILPQALVATASQVNGYNTTGAQLVGFMANAGGYGGFGSSVTYAFSSADHSGRWGFFDVLNDYQLVINKSEGDPSLRYFSAVARIMKAHGFQMLVDQYNSIPYSAALKGVTGLTPTYDDPLVIYKDLADEIDKAIDTINVGLASVVSPTPLSTATDPMFKGNMTKWKQFANTLKLKVMVTGNGKVTFSAKNKTFDAAGFLTTDALINPVYQRLAGKQNPKWATWGFSETGADGNKAWMPNTFVMGFYHGEKLLDAGRGAAIYYTYPSTPSNRLGYEGPPAAAPSPSGSFWYPSTNRDGKTAGNARGTLKGPEAGMPIITAAESYFLQAEAIVRGLITGNAKTMFESGILSSFNYLYTLPDGTISGSPSTDFASYMSYNNTSLLANFDLATTTALKIEAIITQKYIAMNMVNSDVAWNDYRRTKYPTLVNTPGATGIQTFASTQSKSTRADHLPTRILYPSSEGAYNSSNVPKGIDPYNSLVFWALQ